MFLVRWNVYFKEKSSAELFRRCFKVMGAKMIRPIDGSVQRKNSVDAFVEMMQAAKIWKRYGRSRFKVEGPNEKGLYLVNTAHGFRKFRIWESLDYSGKGKDIPIRIR